MVPYSKVQYSTLRYGTSTVQYSIVRYVVVQYDTVRYLYGTVRYDIWITKGNVITKLIRSFELSKNCSKIRVLGIMMRTSELGNIG